MSRRLLHQIKDYLKSFERPLNLISSPKVMERPPGSRMVVLSPHFDDDVIGCGGTLNKHVLAGKEISIIYFTDGKAGDPSIADKDRLSELRKKEARMATQILGIDELIFLDEPETKLTAKNDLIKRLYLIIKDLNPDTIYLPSFLDNHIDHFEVNRILLKLSSEFDSELNVVAYEVWTTLIPNLIIDITSVISKKKEALKQYKTQVHQVDYVTTTLALNKYRTIYNLKGQGYAEAFLFMPLARYVNILRRLKINKRLFISRSHMH